MHHLTKLFSILELTRHQLQTGYIVGGVRKEQLSTLAEHHYLVCMIAWQLARNANRAGAHLNGERVLEFALLHDLGELLGGDISGPYAKVNRRAYRAAKLFELENQRFLAKFFGSDAAYFRATAKEILQAKSDEAIVAKVADYLEAIHFKCSLQQGTKEDVQLALEKSLRYVKRMKDKVARSVLSDFLQRWAKEVIGTSTHTTIV